MYTKEQETGLKSTTALCGIVYRDQSQPHPAQSQCLQAGSMILNEILNVEQARGKCNACSDSE